MYITRLLIKPKRFIQSLGLKHSSKFYLQNILKSLLGEGWYFRLRIRVSTSQYYTCQFSRLRVENFDLMPAQACGPISHALLKNVSWCRLAWHNFQKYVNSDPRKERKPCVKWINDDTFLVKSTGSGLMFIRVLRLGLGNARAVFAFVTVCKFGRLRTSSENFGLLRESSEMIVSSSKIPALPE